MSALPTAADRAPASPAARSLLDKRWLEPLLVLVIVLLALALRTWQLQLHPPGLYNDEAAYGMDALDVAEGKNFAIFFERNNGREPLFIYLAAIAFRILGGVPYALRLTAALLGTLTVLTTYWMARETMRFWRPDDRRLGVFFAAWVGFFLAVSYWHLSFSRLGFRAITLPLVMTIAMALFWRLWRRLREGGRTPWLAITWTGLAIGLSFYTYSAGRLVIVLFVSAAALTLIMARILHMPRRPVVVASAWVVLIALLAFAPLGWYFLQHPGSFAARAASVSIFSEQFAKGDPVGALVNSVVKTVLMFFTEPDANRRHNPAGVPVMDPLLGAWLALGMVLALVRWRDFPRLVYLGWAALFVMPAVLTAEGIPHSLRSIGVIPAAYVLAVSAMLWVGELVFRRRRTLALWLPLPFLLLSGFVGVRAYFGAWSDPERFRNAFLTDFVDLGKAIRSETGDEVWLLTLSPVYSLSDDKLNTVDFFVRDPNKYATVMMDEKTAPQRVEALLEGRDTVHLLRPYEKTELTEASFTFLDAKGMMDFLLRRRGRLVEQRDGSGPGGIPYWVYAIEPQGSLEIPSTPLPADITYGDAVRLTGYNLGATWSEATGDPITIRSDQPLWAVLRWEALRDIDYDLKTSLILKDAEGNVAAQEDGLLTGDGYPLFRIWKTGEASSTYHIVTPLPAVPPGRYTLHLGVYEDQSGRVYPGQAAGEEPTLQPAFAEVVVTPPEKPGAGAEQIQPQTPVDDGALGDGLNLLGFDLARREAAPGDTLPVTLYWRAEVTPTLAATVTLTLLDDTGAAIGESTRPLGGAAFPVSQWRAGEVVRDWHALSLDANAPNGEYKLKVSLAQGGDEDGKTLATLNVAGRPRVFERPTVATPVTATFGRAVALEGVDAPSEVQVAAGDTVALDLVWRVVQPPAMELIRFVQLLNSEGQLVAQQDTVPCGLQCPATSWVAGEYLVDAVTLALPAELAAGNYTLVTGWYEQATQQRLSAFDAEGQPAPDDAIRLPVRIMSGN